MENRVKKCIKHEKIKSRRYVVLDIVTGCNSIYLVFDSALRFSKVFEQWEEDDEYYHISFK